MAGAGESRAEGPGRSSRCVSYRPWRGVQTEAKQSPGETWLVQCLQGPLLPVEMVHRREDGGKHRGLRGVTPGPGER